MMSLSRVGLVLTVSWSVAGYSTQSFDALLQSPDFKRYAYGLLECQKAKVGFYRPLELIRLDLIDQALLKSHIVSCALQWRAFDGSARRRSQESEKLSLSCKCNDALARLIFEQERRLNRSLNGSSIDVIQFLPADARTALSPLDGLFLNSSEVGKKIAKDLKTKPEISLEAVRFDTKTNTIDFEGQRGTTDRLRLAPQTFYQLKSTEMPDGRQRIRGTFTSSSDPVGSDLTLRPEYLAGRFFDPKQSRQFEFGPFPQKQELFYDESGSSHFEGDGHNHSHKH